MANSQFIVLFRGDDSDFIGNQQIVVELQTDLDISGCSAHFRFLDFAQDFDTIPNDKRLALVFPAESTKDFPLGAMDGELWLIDDGGKRRTIANRIHIVVTKCIDEAYDNDSEQAITVVINSNSLKWENIEKPFSDSDVFDMESSDWQFRKVVAKIHEALGGKVINND